MRRLREDPVPEVRREVIRFLAGHEGQQAQPGGDHQQPGEQDEFLRPEGGAEERELALCYVEQDRRRALPGDPGACVEHEEQQHQQVVMRELNI